MKNVIIFSSCLFVGSSLGNIAGTSMSMALKVDSAAGPYIGAITGGIIGILLSPLFMLGKAKEGPFEVLILCFSLSYPVALISGFARQPWISICLSLTVILSIYFFATRTFRKGGFPVLRKKLLVIPLVAIVIALLTAYVMEDEMFHNDVSALIEMMGDDDLAVHTKAARKLMKYGKEPFLIGLRHENPNVRAVAAHFIGLLKDPTVQDILFESATDKDKYVRMWTAFSLGQVGNEKAIPILIVLSNDKEEIVRIRAKEALKKIQG